MLEKIRESVKNPIFAVLLGLIILSFIFAGVFSPNLFSGDPNAIATVDDATILRSDFERAFENERRRYGDVLNDNQQLEQMLRQNLLQRLIDSKLAEQAAADLNLAISRERLIETIRTLPIFQENGRYSKARADMWLSRSGYSRDRFLAEVANSMTQTQLMRAIAESEFALTHEVSQLHSLENETRGVRALRISAEKFVDRVEVTEQEIADYYNTQQLDFMKPEQATVEYIELDMNDIAASQEVTDQEIAQYFLDNKSEFQGEEERVAAHILVSVKEDASEEAIAEAEQKAEEIKAQLDEGADFSELAKELSDDSFSAEQGGELGPIARGAMAPEFEEALFSIEEEGGVAEPVKTSFGYHVIKLTELNEPEPVALDEVRDELRSRLQRQRAEDKFYATQELLTNNSFDNPDSLQPAADATGLKIQTAKGVTRAGGPGIFSNPVVAEAVFSDLVLKDRHNSDPVELGEQHLVVVRVKEHSPAEVKPLETVKDEIVERIKKDKASEQAQELGNQLIAKLEEGQSVEENLASHQLEWQTVEQLSRNSAAIGAEMRDKAFKLNAPLENESAIAGMALQNGDYGIVELLEVNPVKDSASESEAEQLRQRLTRWYGEADYRSLIESLRAEADIESRLQVDSESL